MSDFRHVFAGKEAFDRWEADKQANVPNFGGLYDSDALCAFQGKQADQGRRGCKVDESIYGWTLRYDSGLQNHRIILATGSDDLDNAMEEAKRWVAQDPKNRYAWISKYELERA